MQCRAVGGSLGGEELRPEHAPATSQIREDPFHGVGDEDHVELEPFGLMQGCECDLLSVSSVRKKGVGLEALLIGHLEELLQRDLVVALRLARQHLGERTDCHAPVGAVGVVHKPGEPVEPAPGFP